MGDIIRIPNITDYTQEIINGNLILTPKKQYITENEVNMTQITHSVIKKCIIKKEEVTISTNASYRSVLIDIWKSMPTQLILQTSTFNLLILFLIFIFIFKLTKEKAKKVINGVMIFKCHFKTRMREEHSKKYLIWLK